MQLRITRVDLKGFTSQIYRNHYFIDRKEIKIKRRYLKKIVSLAHPCIIKSEPWQFDLQHIFTSFSELDH